MSLFSVSPLGVITVDMSEIENDVVNAWKQALGQDLNTDAGTPQGQLIIQDVQNLSYVQDEYLKLANSFSVYYAEGDALDRAGAFFGYYRKFGVATVVSVTLTGTAETVVPSGTAFSNGENEFDLTEDAEIGANGTVTAQAQCTESGAIPCLAGTLTTISTPVSGLDSVTNPTDGIKGYATETDNEFRNRITANWLNARAKALLPSIIDRVAALPNVHSVVGRENYAPYQQVIDGVTMERNSIYLCVLGGNGSDIAEVLTQTKTLGAGTNGGTMVSFYEPSIEYHYNYLIERPAYTPIKVQIEYKTNAFTTADVASTAKETLISFVTSNPFKVGQTVAGNALANAFDDFPYFDLLSLKVALASSETFTDYVGITIEQVAVLSSDDITISEVS